MASSREVHSEVPAGIGSGGAGLAPGASGKTFVAVSGSQGT